MSTITIWILFTLGYNGRPTLEVTRFATMAECQRVQTLLIDNGTLRCIQATVFDPSPAPAATPRNPPRCL